MLFRIAGKTAQGCTGSASTLVRGTDIVEVAQDSFLTRALAKYIQSVLLCYLTWSNSGGSRIYRFYKKARL